MLVRHSHVLKKLRREISELDRYNELNRTHLRSLQYLQNIMKEGKKYSKGGGTKWHILTRIPLALRLCLSVTVNFRTAMKTTILPTGGGPDRKAPVLISEGTNVTNSVYTMHRRPDLYGMDAECFRPERWDEDLPLFRDRTTQKYGYLPFSGGPRVCLGSESPAQE